MKKVTSFLLILLLPFILWADNEQRLYMTINNSPEPVVIQIGSGLEPTSIDNNSIIPAFNYYDIYSSEILIPMHSGEKESISRMQNEREGSIWRNVSIPDENGIASYRDAVCIYEGKHAFYYLESGYKADIELIEKLSDAFDASYGIITDTFGEVSDVDGNGKVRVLISDTISSYGFYLETDQFQDASMKELSGGLYASNESDMIYLNYGILNSEYASPTLAHELFHMAFVNERLRNNLPIPTLPFINEGLAMLSEKLCGYEYGHDKYISDYLKEPENCSVYSDNSSDLYGMGLLFFSYINDEYGIDGIAREKGNDLEIVEGLTGKTFEELFEEAAISILADKSLHSTILSNSYEIDDETLYTLELLPYSICFFFSDEDQSISFYSDSALCYSCATY